MQKTKELRYAAIEPSGVSEMTLVGTPVVFEEPTEISLEDGTSFTEIIHRHALDHCDLRDSTLHVNHDGKSLPLARTGKTMQLAVTDEGLRMVAHLSPESQAAREVYESIRRGDVSGMSFAFTCPEGGSTFDPLTNTRHIHRIERILEVSIVERPAYASASVEARSAITAERDALRVRTAGRAQRIQAMARAIAITQR